jgi:hypothetical protein
MGVRAQKPERPPMTDIDVDAQWIAARCSVSTRTARRWIVRLTERYITFKDGRFKKKGRRVLRIPMSLLEEHLDELYNR